MRYKTFTKEIIFLMFALILLLGVATACIEIKTQNPDEIVKKYWEFCLKKNFTEATKLACVDGDCLNFIRTNSNQTITTNSGTIDNNGNVLKSSSIGIDTCCKSDLISEKELALKKIHDVSASKNYAAVKIEAETQDNKSLQFLGCLKKDSNNNWKLRSLVFDENWTDYNTGDGCYVKMDGGKQPSNNQSNE